ncbi:MAG TPA: hypothetical protein VFU43_10825 [Streptosporangiaceae bacterium]|nr:hypothetical protein [Streptosporangiaceae bacterium]
MARRLFRLRTVPGRVRMLTACALLAVGGLISVTAVGLWQARDGLRTLGTADGRTVIAGAGLYGALTDMDLQVTNVLLTGQEAGWLCEPEAADQDQAAPADETGQAPQDDAACDRAPARVLYEIRRETAQQAALAAARLADGDPVRLGTVRAVLDGLHQYDQRVRAAMELGQQAEHPLGMPPAAAVARYRFATALMTEELLPGAYNLTLDGQASVHAAYEDRRAAARAGMVQAVVAGGLAIAILAGLQIYLGFRFRRVLNPALAVATLGVLALTLTSGVLLSAEARDMRVAKVGFDQALALSRAQSIGTSMDADRGRFLLDPGNADRYDQLYLDKAQSILYLPVTKLAAYHALLGGRLDRYGDDSRVADFGGFYGAEARTVADRANGAQAAREPFAALLSRYGRYQRTDRQVRELAAAGRRTDAAIAHMDPDDPTLAHRDLRAYNDGLSTLITHHQYLTDRTVQDAQRAMTAWTWLLPAAFLVIAALIVAGVGPRLKEYR